ncbi:sentrin-specific protease 7 isoform X3 [Numida meleagris]|uniref:sentrin-specific protease 7 isoform X3 n=1 Tax=Numida meleagris TaxID=8996 RepID=UPI000B3DE260|nr:sentrin-specific protease 7 isoform X3 [Numida meleagris]XP_021255832.1 sentrin-specific protease 7 isoform X3 [Numida meleagris]
MEGRPSPSSHVSWRLSASNRETSTKGRRQRDCGRCSSNDEESIGQPKVILTNVLRTKIGRKYTQAQPKTDANFSDAGKLQSHQPPASSVASLKIWQILNPALHSLFLSKRQPQVILTNVLRTRIGRKYVDSHILIDSNLSDAEKLELGQLASSSVASAQTCQILSSPHESSFLSERPERLLTKSDCSLSKEPERSNVILTFRRRKLEKKENKNADELDKKRKNMNTTSLSWKGSSSLDSGKRKRRFSGYISDDCKEHIPEKSLLQSKEQRLSSARSSGCRTPREDEQDHRSNLVQDCVAQTLERDYKDTPTNNQLGPVHSCSEEPGSESAPTNLSEKQLVATSVSPRVGTIRKLKMDTSQYLNKLRNRICRSNRPLVSADPIVLSSDDEDGSSEPKDEGLSEPECKEQLQVGITDVQVIDQQSDVHFSEKLLEDNTESHTEQLLTKSDEDKCPTILPSGSIHSEQMKPGLDFEFDSLYIGKFKWSSTGPVKFMTKYITIPFQVALNKNIKLTVDTLDVRRFGLWRNDGGCSSTTIIFIWLSVDYLEKIETQLGKRVSSKPSKSSEFVFLELSQPLTELEEVRLSELITEISKKNRAPDLPELLSLKQALLLFKDLSPEESSFMSSSEDLLKQCATKENISFAHEPAFQKSKPKVARPSYTLANKQNSGCYSISLSSAPNEEWKEVGESGGVKNLIVYPPPPAKGGLGVTREDLKCLEYGEFLNDVIIDFYLKYLLLEKAPKHLAERTHIFSSFFYKCLTRTEKFSEGDPKVSEAQRRHKRVRTWTRHINIFSKDYIFVPVNQESHWYIAVICFPWLEETVYEECPHQNSFNLSPLHSENKSEDTVIGSVLAYPEEEMDANRILFSKGGNESGASASVLDSGISKISLNNSKRQICKRPCILILDSLKAGSVQKTVQVLREYLEVEWEAKRKTHREFNKSTMIDFYPRVPKQDNSSDCGVYLLQYVESFFQNPIVDFEQPVHLEKWFPRQLIRSKREEIQDLILQLHFQQLRGSRS